MSSSTLRIAWRNLGRNRRRTALAVMAVGVGQFALLFTMSLMHGYADNIRQAITGPMIGHLQVHHPEWREERAMDLSIPNAVEIAARIRQEPDVASVSARIYAPCLVAPKQDAHAALVVGLDIAQESESYGLLSDMSEGLAPRHVLVGYGLAQRLQLTAGQEIALVGQAPNGALANDLYMVQAIIRTPADPINQSGIVMSLPDARELFYMDEEAHELVVRATKSRVSEVLAASLAQAPELAELEVMSWGELVPDLALLVKMSDWVGYIVVLLVLVASIAGIANTLMMSTFERSHELGMLLALGSGPGRLVRLVMVEALLIGLLGVLAGTLAGGLSVAISASQGIDFASWGGAEARDMAYQGLNLPLLVYPRLELLDSIIGLVAIILTSLLAALYPAWVTSQLEPVEAMRA